ncbi:hypothetical protein pqer_cds_707 [Pandoravirus quercus]|uniref:Uncharacterized protein n=2 Tax=Pandoravirus TaxID=2060084 RepID=A0A2U7U9L8_9VIRU|nr:hypothetical protein pqer_cds_707 [Pandoravirus quercus]AVK75129.1 hypothetical protein pqer_cds_707 [Pandoravirus quercus]QBZ81293.1 hypothetical protein pclt_cds_706 [Pandoravirus celtis]
MGDDTGDRRYGFYGERYDWSWLERRAFTKRRAETVRDLKERSFCLANRGSGHGAGGFIGRVFRQRCKDTWGDFRILEADMDNLCSKGSPCRKEIDRIYHSHRFGEANGPNTIVPLRLPVYEATVADAAAHCGVVLSDTTRALLEDHAVCVGSKRLPLPGGAGVAVERYCAGEGMYTLTDVAKVHSVADAMGGQGHSREDVQCMTRHLGARRRWARPSI